MNKILCLIFCFLVLGVGSGWGEDLTVTGDIQMNKSLRMDNGVRTWVLHSDNAPDEFRLMSNGTNLDPVLTIKPDGKVGIGTNNPLSKLSIQSAISGYVPLISLNESSNNGKNAMGIDWLFGGLAGFPWGPTGRIEVSRQGTAATFDMIFHAGYNGLMDEKLRISGNGNVGIGTATPGAKLHITESGNGTMELLRLDNPNLANENKGAKISFYETASYETGKLENTWSTSESLWSLSLGPRGALDALKIKGDGNVGIGTPTPTCKLDVKGKIRAEEIKVEVVDATDIRLKNDAWADYVFKDNYILKPLSEVESFIKENKHLPDVPSAVEIQKEGLNMSEMMSTQMKKIEELTLHLINQNKLISEQNNQMLEMKKTLTDENNQLKAEVELLKQKMVK